MTLKVVKQLVYSSSLSLSVRNYAYKQIALNIKKNFWQSKFPLTESRVIITARSSNLDPRTQSLNLATPWYFSAQNIAYKHPQSPIPLPPTPYYSATTTSSQLGTRRRHTIDFRAACCQSQWSVRQQLRLRRVDICQQGSG